MGSDPSKPKYDPVAELRHPGPSGKVVKIRRLKHISPEGNKLKYDAWLYSCGFVATVCFVDGKDFISSKVNQPNWDKVMESMDGLVEKGWKEEVVLLSGETSDIEDDKKGISAKVDSVS